MSVTRRQRSRGITRPPDWRSFAETHSDNKQWVSMAIVVTDPAVSPVEFSREDGQVYVNVSLEPSKTPARCRVGSQIAGAGEGEYFPFIPGDEVLVVLPEGREDAGAVIIARLNGALDPFPMDSVAGQDPTSNSFAFRRRRTPYLEEQAGPVVFRNALTGALLSLDAKGGVTLMDGEHSTLQLSADAVTLQGPSNNSSPPRLLLQLNVTEERGLLQVGDAQLLLNSSKSGDPSFLTLPDALFVSFGNNQPAEHVLTTEAFLALFGAFMTQLATAAGVLPITAAHVAATFVSWAATIASGGVPMLPPLAMALSSGLPVAASSPKPPVDPVSNVQVAPGLGAVFFHTG